MLYVVSPPLDDSGTPVPDRAAPAKSPRPVPSNRPPPRLTIVRPVADCECLSLVARLLIWATRNTPAARERKQL